MPLARARLFGIVLTHPFDELSYVQNLLRNEIAKRIYYNLFYFYSTQLVIHSATFHSLTQLTTVPYVTCEQHLLLTIDCTYVSYIAHVRYVPLLRLKLIATQHEFRSEVRTNDSKIDQCGSIRKYGMTCTGSLWRIEKTFRLDGRHRKNGFSLAFRKIATCVRASLQSAICLKIIKYKFRIPDSTRTAFCGRACPKRAAGRSSQQLFPEYHPPKRVSRLLSF
jgi:hypothetical protein